MIPNLTLAQVLYNRELEMVFILLNGVKGKKKRKMNMQQKLHMAYKAGNIYCLALYRTRLPAPVFIYCLLDCKHLKGRTWFAHCYILAHRTVPGTK